MLDTEKCQTNSFKYNYLRGVVVSIFLPLVFMTFQPNNHTVYTLIDKIDQNTYVSMLWSRAKSGISQLHKKPYLIDS